VATRWSCKQLRTRAEAFATLQAVLTAWVRVDENLATVLGGKAQHYRKNLAPPRAPAELLATLVEFSGAEQPPDLLATLVESLCSVLVDPARWVLERFDERAAAYEAFLQAHGRPPSQHVAAEASLDRWWRLQSGSLRENRAGASTARLEAIARERSKALARLRVDAAFKLPFARFMRVLDEGALPGRRQNASGEARVPALYEDGLRRRFLDGDVPPRLRMAFGVLRARVGKVEAEYAATALSRLHARNARKRANAEEQSREQQSRDDAKTQKMTGGGLARYFPVRDP